MVNVLWYTYVVYKYTGIEQEGTQHTCWLQVFHRTKAMSHNNCIDIMTLSLNFQLLAPKGKLVFLKLFAQMSYNENLHA